MKKISFTAALFDSSVLVPLLDDRHVHHQKAQEFFTELTNKSLLITISSQNILEISIVLCKTYKTEFEVIAAAIDKFLDDSLVRVIYPNPAVIDRFLGMLKTEKSISYCTDLFLAATALEYGFDTIVTNDRDFGKIKGIRVFNPFID